MAAASTDDEWFDVVDAADRVIGRERRRIVHRDGLRHRAIHILLERPDGAVLLQRRSGTKDTFPHCWDSSCSGHLDSGEDYRTAAARELAEELGIVDCPSLKEILRVDACPESGMEFVRVYHARWDGPVDPDPEEISEIRWLERPAIDRLLMNHPETCARSFVYLWNRLNPFPHP
ncbi:MAG: NUDIX hydrolase [Opitutales bacterium]